MEWLSTWNVNMPNGRIYFLGALYHTLGGFSHLPRFVGKIADHLDPLAYERGAVLDKVQYLRENLTRVEGPVGDREALGLLIAEDLGAVETILLKRRVTAKIDQETDYHNELRRCRDKAIKLLNAIGLKANPPKIFFVEELPSPYDQAGYSALTADMGDEEKHGIKAGVYFVNEGLRPFYSKFLLVHELIHSILGDKSPSLLGRGLEEGLAEIVGSIYLSSKILGTEITRNLFVYNRLSYGHRKFWELYMDYTRQAAFLLHRFGLDGLVSLLGGGREKVKDIENLCLRMEFQSIGLPAGNWNSDLSDLVDYLALAFGRNLVVSPLAKYLSRYVLPGRTTTEILAEGNAERDAGKKALRELQDQVSIALFRSDQVIVSSTDCGFLSPGTVIRYDIPGSE